MEISYITKPWGLPLGIFFRMTLQCHPTFYGGRPSKICAVEPNRKATTPYKPPKAPEFTKLLLMSNQQNLLKPSNSIWIKCPTDSTKNQQPKPRPLQSQVNPSRPSRFLPCRFNSGNKVAICRAPVAPKGCPRAMAPPLGFTSGCGIRP